jgi:hypothetical protein
MQVRKRTHVNKSELKLGELDWLGWLYTPFTSRFERFGAIRRSKMIEDDRTHAINWVPAVHANFLLMNVVANVIECVERGQSQITKKEEQVPATMLAPGCCFVG